MTTPVNDTLRVRAFADELRKWWSFDDGQRHTHSWHSREDFIERKLPALLAVNPVRAVTIDTLNWPPSALAAIETLQTENWQLKQACGYPIPADKETINNPFKCGMCDARNSPDNGGSELRKAAERVCWFDWSDNDTDAVAAIDALRKAITSGKRKHEPDMDAYIEDCGQ